VSRSAGETTSSPLWSVVSAGAKCNEPFFEATPDCRWQGPCQYGRWHGPCLDDIYRSRHLIRHLSLLGAPAGVEEFQYPNLHHLVVELVFYHPYRTVISLDLLESLSLSSEFARPLIQHPIQNNHWPHLNKLHLSGLLDKDVASILGGAGDGPGNIVELGLDHCQLKTQAARFLDSALVPL
jgi:hypothetical protein